MIVENTSFSQNCLSKCQLSSSVVFFVELVFPYLFHAIHMYTLFTPISKIYRMFRAYGFQKSSL